MNKKLNHILKRSNHLKIDKNSKLVIMSDCHRGIGNNYDNFLKNENIYQAALTYYFEKGFTYIELGDGDDMWEVKNYEDIIEEHLDSFKILKKFHRVGRLIMIYGNHDKCKENLSILKDYLYKYHNKITKTEEELLNYLYVNESLVLTYEDREIFLIHGHQVDLLNSTFWRLSRFLVRHVWRNLEYIGIKDPTNAAKNYSVTRKVEKRLKKWSIDNNKILITGHTHRPIFPKIGDSLYFNDGSCIHPNGITCIEIENGKITLVRWMFSLCENKFICVGRRRIAGAESILNFF